MIVQCPKCGAENRIPASPDPSKRYRCGRCNTGLNDALQAPDSHVERAKSSKSSLFKWIENREKLVICSLALLALFLQLVIVPYRTTFVLDEVYYVPEARSIIHEGELTNPEHPSLGKLFIASGISVFGDNQWGWRIPSIIFAVASIVIFYFICRKLIGKYAAFLATFLLIFETLTFNHSGLAMLDVFSLTFMLLSFLLYLHARYVFSGIALALSVLCKMTGLLGILVILVHLLIKRRRQAPRSMTLFLASAFIAFMLLMPLFDFAATREWLSPIDRIWDMWVIHKAKTFENLEPLYRAYADYPWEWILKPFGYMWNPEFLGRLGYEWDPELGRGQYFSQISLTVWVLIIPMTGYMVYEFVKNKTDVSLIVLTWFTATYLFWIPLVAITDRQSYLWYFYPTVGAICMAIGFGIVRLWDRSSKGRLARHGRLIRAILVGYLALHVVFFLLFTPMLHVYLFYS